MTFTAVESREDKMKVTIEIKYGNNQEPTAEGIDVNIDAIQRAINSEMMQGDDVVLMDTITILKAIKEEIGETCLTYELTDEEKHVLSLFKTRSLYALEYIASRSNEIRLYKLYDVLESLVVKGKIRQEEKKHPKFLDLYRRIK